MESCPTVRGRAWRRAGRGRARALLPAGVALLHAGGLAAQERAAGAEALLERLHDPASGYVLVAAHRGGREHDWRHRAPENSLANVDKAVRMGFDVFETDIRESADGELVIMHDATVDRTTNGSGRVADLTLARLKDLDLVYSNGSLSDEAVPSLEDLLVRGKGRILFKADVQAGLESLPGIVRLLEKHGMLGQVFLRLDWSEEAAAALEAMIRRGMPYDRHLILFRVRDADEVRAALSRFDVGAVEVERHVGLPSLGRRVAGRLGLHGVRGWLDDRPLPRATVEAIRVARASGVLVAARSDGGPVAWRRLVDHGVRMVHAEQPELVTAWLRGRGLHR